MYEWPTTQPRSEAQKIVDVGVRLKSVVAV
jgi:hypothetical protein